VNSTAAEHHPLKSPAAAVAVVVSDPDYFSDLFAFLYSITVWVF